MYLGAQRRTPLSRVATEAFSTTIQGLGELMSSDADYSHRIRQGLVHLARAEAVDDLEESLGEFWRCLEILAGDATKLEPALCWAPLYVVPSDFSARNSREKLNMIEDKYKRNRRAFRQLVNARNKLLVHRPVAVADWKVLEEYSEWTRLFVRGVLLGSIQAHRAGARCVAEIKRTLDRAYWNTFGIHLPSIYD
jgi:hypothetical protein